MFFLKKTIFKKLFSVAYWYFIVFIQLFYLLYCISVSNYIHRCWPARNDIVTFFS